jgi:maleate isomerase
MLTIEQSQMSEHLGTDLVAIETVRSVLSSEEMTIPASVRSSLPALAETGVILNGRTVEAFAIDSERGYPDMRSFRRKFGLLLPATNTSMEHELWTILLGSRRSGGLEGIGLHTSNVFTPRPQLRTEEDLLEYRRQFLAGLRAALQTALLAEPQYLIMGMSLEHILSGIEEIKAALAHFQNGAPLGLATWHDASAAALKAYNAKRIGLLTPFDRLGNNNASRMFEDMGFNVVASVGFSCANARHIAHVPDWAKEKAIIELLARPENRLDAVVQCGTNMSLINVTERLEPLIGIPILGINAVLLWYALRTTGIDTPVEGAGRLLREF